jgi:dimethylglycine dehydrogenase
MAEHARVVIIGGGAVGCSALYHLALLGWTECLLLERDELTSGSTWHAAGNCPTFSTSWNIIKLQRYSNQLYARLSASQDTPITYHPTGSIRLAHSRNRMDEFSHVRAMARAQGLELELITPSEAKELYPYLELDDLEGVLLDPYDGDVDPSQLTQAFAREARARGCEIRRFTRVTGLETRPRGGWRVLTDKGAIECETVVNAAGYRAGEIMAMVGQYLPIVAMSHQYLVTEAIPELQARRDKKLPLLRDPDVSYYLRQERSGLLLGPYEWDATPHWQGGIPEEFANQLYEDDLDRLERYIEAAIARVPILGSVGVQRVINGPIPYSPDGNPYIGPAHGLENFYQCCCFSFGIAQAGGAGKIIAEWVTQGEPEWDMWPFDPRRYTGYATKAYVVAKAIELYQNEYAIAFPCEERPAGRPARTTALYDRLRAKGAMFGARGGWERATWFPREGEPGFPREGEPGEQRLSFHRTNWHETVGEECRAVRERVGILDLGGFTTLVVRGPGAAAWLDRLICTRLPKVGRVGLAYMLNERGGIVSELTITPLAEDRFHLLSAAAAEWHDQDWLRARLPDDGSVRIEDLTGRLGTLILAGPRAREVLSDVSDADLSNDLFPWLSARKIEIGVARPLVLRAGYTGELGFELHAPMEHLVPLYDALWSAGEAHGIRDFGMYALESLRLEKCYRAWKVDLTYEYTPLMASFGRLVDWAKPAFTGRAALLAEQEKGPRERLVPLTLDEPGSADAPACAPVWERGEIVGLVTSGGFGHALGKSIALAYLRPELAIPGAKVEVEVLGELRAATVGREPLYDPGNARLRA